jgi:pyruvate formate-lyase activating enzyme-like uncharacterized protein
VHAQEVVAEARVASSVMSAAHLRFSGANMGSYMSRTYKERLDDAQLQVHLTTVKPSNKRATLKVEVEKFGVEERLRIPK